MRLSPDSAFEVNEPAIISETIDGETVIINLATGSYYSLKHSGAAIWGGIQQHACLTDIAALVSAGFEADGQDVEEHVFALVQRLIDEDLIRPAPESRPLSTFCAAAGAGGGTPFSVPLLDKFTDMEAMLLLDPVHDVDEEGWPNQPEQGGRVDA